MFDSSMEVIRDLESEKKKQKSSFKKASFSKHMIKKHKKKKKLRKSHILKSRKRSGEDMFEKSIDIDVKDISEEDGQ